MGEGHFKHNLTIIKKLPDGSSITLSERWDEQADLTQYPAVYAEMQNVVEGLLPKPKLEPMFPKPLEPGVPERPLIDPVRTLQELRWNPPRVGQHEWLPLKAVEKEYPDLIKQLREEDMGDPQYVYTISGEFLQRKRR